MAPEMSRTPVSPTRKAGPRPVNRTAERIFFGSMADLLCVIVFVGFFRTYFGAGVFEAPLPAPILQIHGAVFTLWMLVFLTQTAFIPAHRLAWHRSFGTVAFCLPPLMVVLGVMAAIDALGRKVRIGPLDPAISLAIPLFAIVGFAILAFAAWRARRNPAAHKRLILLATIGLMKAAFARFPWSPGIPPAIAAVTGLGVLLLLVIAWDLFSLHRIHRSTWWGAPLTSVLGACAIPVGRTAAWHSIAAFLARTIAR